MKKADKRLRPGDRVMVSGHLTNNPATVVNVDGQTVIVRYDNHMGKGKPKPAPVSLSRVERMK